MHLDWLLNPLTVYALAAAGLSLSLALFVSIKREVAKCRGMAGEWQTLRESDQTALRGLQAEIDGLRESLRHLAEVPPGRPAGMGINLTKRAQALRMHRRGESIPTIAAALETPANEIALLLKVHVVTNTAQHEAS
jgi:hypothetical protein